VIDVPLSSYGFELYGKFRLAQGPDAAAPLVRIAAAVVHEATNQNSGGQLPGARAGGRFLQIAKK